MVEIRLAKDSQHLEVLYIVREGFQQLLKKGVKYWHNSHADYANVLRDIANMHVYILFYKKIAVGTITLKPYEDDISTAFIDRLSIFPLYQKRGLAKKLLDFAISEAIRQGYTSIRGTIPINDTQLSKLLENFGFANKGEVCHVPNEMLRILFEKQL